MEEKLTFKDNMEKPGKMFPRLEKGDIPLKKAVDLYGEGVKLSAACKNSSTKLR